ncbi:hypothetical protein ABW21_db0209465 [Orbilia brochopaga]|nr:hypothetical protein ABW21_db0209465 [Drechslerella brochopaga]
MDPIGETPIVEASSAAKAMDICKSQTDRNVENRETPPDDSAQRNLTKECRSSERLGLSPSQGAETDKPSTPLESYDLASLSSDSREPLDYEPDSNLTTFYNRANVSNSASIVGAVTEDYDLIDFLAIVQDRRVDLCPFLWDADEDRLGLGGTASIAQGGEVVPSANHGLAADLPIGFAFKRFQREGARYEADRNRVFQALLSEVFILGHPVIQQHPHINKLRGITWDTVYGETWPVLVFERAECGDLKQFMKTEGRKLSIRAKVKLFYQIGDAIRLMHSCHAIHGDLKPENLLVFKSSDGEYSVRVTDFGYSTILTENDESTNIVLPRSWPWTSPDVEQDPTVTVGHAKSADIFSYGLICFWVLCYGILPSAPDTDGMPDPHVIQKLKAHTDLIPIVKENVGKVLAEKDSQEALELKNFFSDALSEVPSNRKLSIDNLPSTFGFSGQYLPLMEQYGKSALLKSTTVFSIVTLLSQLRYCRQGTREAIFKCLEQRANNHIDISVRRSSAYEIAFCYRIGFAVPLDEEQSNNWLEKANKTQEDLNDALEMIMLDSNSLYINVRLKSQYLKTQEGSNLEEDEDIFHYAALCAWTAKQLGHENTEIVMVQRDCLVNSRTAQREIQEMMEADVPEEVRRAQRNPARFEAVFSLDPKSQVPALGLRLPTQIPTNRREENNWAVEIPEPEDSKLRKSIEIKNRVLGPDHDDTLKDMEKLYGYYTRKQMLEEAEPLLISIVHSRQKVYGKEHPTSLQWTTRLFALLLIKNMLEEAESILSELIDIKLKVSDPKHPHATECAEQLEILVGGYLRDGGASDKVIQLLEKLVGLQRKARGLVHPNTLRSTQFLALLLSNRKSHERAKEVLTGLAKDLENELGKDHIETIENKKLLLGLDMTRIREQQIEIDIEVARMRFENSRWGKTEPIPLSRPTLDPQKNGPWGPALFNLIEEYSAGWKDWVLKTIPEILNILPVIEAVEEAEQLIQSLEDNSTARVGALMSTADAYVRRFFILAEPDDLDIGIIWAEQALQIAQGDGPETARTLSQLSSYLWFRFITAGQIEDLDSAIEHAETSVLLTPDDDQENRLKRMEDLSFRLKRRHKQAERQCTAKLHPERIPTLIRLHDEISGLCLEFHGACRNDFAFTKDPEDKEEAAFAFNEALRHTEEAVKLASKMRSRGDGYTMLEPSIYGGLVLKLAIVYFRRYEMLNDVKDLEQASRRIEEASHLVPLYNFRRDKLEKSRDDIQTAMEKAGVISKGNFRKNVNI